jgi:hypothetical protein
LLATALTLPLRLTVQVTTPEETVGALQEAVMPVGSPDTTVPLEPDPLVATVTPPTGVAVTVNVAVPIDIIPRFRVFNCIFTPGVAAQPWMGANAHTRARIK